MLALWAVFRSIVHSRWMNANFCKKRLETIDYGPFIWSNVIDSEATLSLVNQRMFFPSYKRSSARSSYASIHLRHHF